MSSTSTNSSSSQSTPTLFETPENNIIDQISGVASGLAQQMNQWAQQEYAKTSQVTDQTVSNFMDVSNKMQGLAGNITNQYENTFLPENQQLVDEANSFASPSRMKLDMGEAGATQAQAGKQAMDNATQQLQQYGIDPSSGRYAALDKAAAVQNAANVAGAMNTQRNADIATGQRLRSEAVQVGAQMPAAIVNADNTAVQANTAAVNAKLANANTGVNMNSLPDKYLGTAMGVKLPLMGNTSTSQSHGSSFSDHPSSPSSGGGGNGGGNGGGGGGGGGNPNMMPDNTAAQGSGMGDPGGSGGGKPNAAIMHIPPFGGDDQPAQTGDPFYDPTVPYNSMNPFNDPALGQPYGDPGVGFGGSDTTNNPGLYDSSQNQPDFSDSSPLAGWQPQSMPDNSSMFPDPTTQFPSTGGGGGSGDDGSSASSAGDFTDMSQYDSTGYSRGGPIINRADGGSIPASASPSGGQQVDDVNAHVNTDEFVIPRDVALWKGQEFFQNLITQSRAKRLGAPAKASPTPSGAQNQPIGAQ